MKGCSHEGIFEIGVAKPESKKDGSITTKLPKIACCCVFEIEEINNPIPDIENKNTTTLKYKSQIEPFNGIPKRKIAIKSIKVDSTILIISAGKSFPKSISNEFKGETKICSKVPNSFSLAIDKAVKSIATTIEIEPNKEGTIHQKLSKFGL